MRHWHWPVGNPKKISQPHLSVDSQISFSYERVLIEHNLRRLGMLEDKERKGEFCYGEWDDPALSPL